MVNFGRKLKMPKTCEKLFHKNIRVILWKKPLEKQQIFENCELFKNQESKERLRPMRRLLPLQNAEFGSKIKNAKKKKNMQKTILQEHESCSVQKAHKKTPNI